MAGDRQGIVIKFLSDFADFLTGKNRVQDGLKDVAGSVDDVADASDQQARASVDGLRDMAGAAGEAKDATDELGDSTERAGSKGTDLVDGLKGGLLGVAGVAGGVAGVVSSVFGKAVDFVKDKIAEQQEAARKLREDLISAYLDAAKAGDTYLAKAQIVAKSIEILNDEAKRTAAESNAAAIGVDANTYIRAQAGDYEALQVVIEAATRAEEERQSVMARNRQEAENRNVELRNVQSILQANKDLLAVHEEGQGLAGQAIQISKDLDAQESARIRRTSDADQARYEALEAAVAKANQLTVDIPVKFDINKKPVEDYIADLKRRKIPIVADVVDRYGREYP